MSKLDELCKVPVSEIRVPMETHGHFDSGQSYVSYVPKENYDRLKKALEECRIQRDRFIKDRFNTNTVARRDMIGPTIAKSNLELAAILQGEVEP